MNTSLYAPAVTRIVAGDYADLSEVLAPTKYKDPGELLLRSLQSQYTAFVMSGFLVSRCRLRGFRLPTLLGKARETMEVEESGFELDQERGYLAYVGPVGVLLQGEDESCLIAFDRPSEESPYHFRSNRWISTASRPAASISALQAKIFI